MTSLPSNPTRRATVDRTGRRISCIFLCTLPFLNLIVVGMRSLRVAGVYTVLGVLLFPGISREVFRARNLKSLIGVIKLLRIDVDGEVLPNPRVVTYLDL